MVFRNASAAGALVYNAEFAPRVAAIRDKLPHLKVLIQVADESGNELLPGAVDYGEVIAQLRERLPADTIVCNGAGNFSVWVHRFWHYHTYPSQLAPTSGAMGYGVPAAVAAKAVAPERTVLCFAGDGDFLMTGQELATAVQYELPILIVVVNNGMYGTIRMHQERHYPGRVVGTDLRNPDFAAYARAFGAHGETVEMKGSGAKPYVLKNSGGVYSCSCPAWRNQSIAIERRTCKHLKKLRGEEAEAARCGQPVAAAPVVAEGMGRSRTAINTMTRATAAVQDLQPDITWVRKVQRVTAGV